MSRRLKMLIVAGTVVVAAAIPAIAYATGGIGGDDSDTAITGPDLARATEAAISHVGGGTVAETEMENGSYEVEVLLDDGTEVEVHLDPSFDVVSSDQERADREGAVQDNSLPDD